MKVGITGVPGTGKTTVSELVGKEFGIPVIHQSDLFGGTVSLKSVRTKLWWILKRMESVVLEGHLLCDIKLPLEYLFILRTDPEILMNRLMERGYSKQKVDENVLAEALDYCLQRAEGRYERIVQIDTTHTSPLEAARKILGCLVGEECKSDDVDWIPVLERMIISGKITYI